MSKSHEPSAEIDSDGMWEPSCERCGMLAGPPFSAVVRRYPTAAEATVAAESILAMVSGEYPCREEP